jgi:hypothetical protein
MRESTEKLYNALVRNGEELTAKQIAARYNIANPHDAVYDLRQNGYAIYLNECEDTNGRVTRKYRAGIPSRELIAAGYRALAAGI